MSLYFAFALAVLAYVEIFNLPSYAVLIFMFVYIGFFIIDNAIVSNMRNDLKNEILEELKNEQEN